MRLLLDTCTFLWVAFGKEDMSRSAIEAFIDPDNEVYLSSVSAWEIVVKYNSGKLLLPVSPDKFIIKERQRHMISSLDLAENDIFHLSKLPSLHKDPFDRMLVCQAIEHSLTILSPDPLITQYPIRCFW